MKRYRHDAEHTAGYGGIGGNAVLSDVCMGATLKNKMKRSLFFWLIVLTVTTLCSQERSFPKLTGPYLGQDPPGTTPGIFAPGIVSLPEFTEYSDIFSPDGRQYYFCRFSDGVPATIYCSKVIAGGWTNPEPVDFSSGYTAYEPHISFDNGSRYFAWNKGPGLPGIWVTKRNSVSRSAPKYAGQGMFVSSDSMGNIYLTEIIDQLRPATGEFTYAITPPDGNAEIFLINADGTGKTQLTDQPGRSYGPAFSPDATKIAFYNHFSDQTWSLYLMNADGTNIQRLTNVSNTLDWSPDWSPDGSQIVFVRSYSSPTWRSQIWMMNADGSNVHRLGNVDGQGPDWSPDGSKIVYFNYVDGGGDIWVMNADGTNPIKLTNNPSEDWWPKFSPDGSKITFHSRRDGNHEIYVMNCDGSNPVRLTNNSADDEDPNWSPDGTKIAFISMRDGHYEIYTMNADGSNQTRITTTDGHAIDPDWKPITNPTSVKDSGYSFNLLPKKKAPTLRREMLSLKHSMWEES